MALVLIHEPDDSVRHLLDAQVAFLGHEPVLHEPGESWSPERFDVAIIEPAYAPGLRLATELAEREPDLPLIFVSIREPSPETRLIETAMAHVVKPFRIAEIAGAIDLALSKRRQERLRPQEPQREPDLDQRA